MQIKAGHHQSESQLSGLTMEPSDYTFTRTEGGQMCKALNVALV